MPKKKMTPAQFEEKMKSIKDEYGFFDKETCHKMMDDLMGELLTSLGYESGIKVFYDTGKWYA